MAIQFPVKNIKSFKSKNAANAHITIKPKAVN